MSWKFKYYDIETGPDWDAIEQNCEWFRELKSVPQDKIWHAEGDVQIHTKMVCEALIKQPEFIILKEPEKHIMFTAALFHDIEKRSTTIEEFRDGRMCITAPSHARRGEGVTREILYRDFECPFNMREPICKLVRYHGRPLYDKSEDYLKTNLITLSWNCKIPLGYLALLSRADILGRICQDQKEQLEKIDLFEMAIDGEDCAYGPKKFSSPLGRYNFFHGHTDSLEYDPFDDRKFEVVMMSGIAGAGKDTIVKTQYSHWPVISLDAIREELKIKPTDKSGNGTVIQLAKERAKEFMRKHKSFVWNATNITSQLRAQLIDLFVSYGAKVTITYVEVPYKKLINQNSQREASVPKEVIEKMIRKFEPPMETEAHFVNYII